MDKPKVLSGQAIVAKGVTKIEASLPEVGLKDVIPNGSWLEGKQIQAALEARKHLIEVERIEKFGTLSHATWRDDLKLAEVTQMAGSYWQFLGHNVGKTLYLRPEEALFLMEINCLLLKHNDVAVSLQKAYSLLLNKTMSQTQYRVYASLSRLGYKVFRHKTLKINKGKSPPCHKIDVDHVESINEQLTINTTLVDNDRDQPLTDSSVEIIDTKISDKNNDVQSNTDDISQEIKIEKTNEIVVIKKENNRSANDIFQVKVISDMVVSGNEVNSGESNETIHNTNKGNKNIMKENVEENNKSSQNVNTEHNETSNNDIVMEVDATATVKRNLEHIEVNTLDVSNEINVPTDCTTSEMSNNENDITENTFNEASTKVEEKNENAGCLTIDVIQEEPDSSGQPNKETNNIHSAIAIEVDSADSDVIMDLETPKSLDVTNDNAQNQTNVSEIDQSLSDVLISKRNQIFHNYVIKLKKLTSRQFKPSNFDNIEKHFENIPELCKKEVSAINVPDQQFIPKNIFVNQTSYVLNLNQIKKKSVRSTSTESAAYTSSDEVNGNHIRRIRSNSATELTHNLQFVNNIRFTPRQTVIFRPFNFWRPHNNHYVQFNMFFQRPYIPNMYFQSRFQYQQRSNHPLLRPYTYSNNANLNPIHSNPITNARKRLRSAKATHLQSIKNLAVRLKQLIMSGSTHIENIEALHRLLLAYNTRYKARLRLNKNFEIVNDENIVETICLEDDEESTSKRPRLSHEGDMFEENLNLLRDLALKLKDLEANDCITPKHRRAMSKAIKTFNKSYDAEIYMNKKYEIINKRFINLDSDSETDCVISEPKKNNKRKKLRNPFNILKRRSEKLNTNNPGTSKENERRESDTSNVETVDATKYNENISKIFNKNWLPQDCDFGRAEVVNRNVMNSRVMDAIKEEYLFNFMKNHFDEFNNWLEAKIAFLQHMEETDIAFQNDHYQNMVTANKSINQSGLKPLMDGFSDMPSVLEKLNIIKNNKEINTSTSLSIHFDVYNRDVQNFRKTNPPKPHFRIICLEDSSSFPSTSDVMALHSQYDDNVTIVFAIVSMSSISYLQINPIDLPVYVANNDMD